MPFGAPVGHEGGVEAELQVRRIHLPDHPQQVVVVVDERLVVLEGEGDPGVARVAGALDQGLAAPAPDLLGGELLVDDRPVALGDVVGGELRVAGHAPPGEEHAEGRGAEVGRHPDQVADHADLRLADLGHGVAEVVVRGDGVDLDPLAVGPGAQVAAAGRRPVERVAVRALAVDLDPVVAVLLGPGDHLREREGLAAVPEAQVGDAVESDLHRDIPFARRDREHDRRDRRYLVFPAAQRTALWTSVR